MSSDLNFGWWWSIKASWVLVKQAIYWHCATIHKQILRLCNFVASVFHIINWICLVNIHMCSHQATVIRVNDLLNCLLNSSYHMSAIPLVSYRIFLVVIFQMFFQKNIQFFSVRIKYNPLQLLALHFLFCDWQCRSEKWNLQAMLF